MPATTSADDLARYLEDLGRRALLNRGREPRVAALAASGDEMGKLDIRLPHHIAQSAELRRAEPPTVSLSEPVAEVGST